MGASKSALTIHRPFGRAIRPLCHTSVEVEKARPIAGEALRPTRTLTRTKKKIKTGPSRLQRPRPPELRPVAGQSLEQRAGGATGWPAIYWSVPRPGWHDGAYDFALRHLYWSMEGPWRQTVFRVLCRHAFFFTQGVIRGFHQGAPPTDLRARLQDVSSTQRSCEKSPGAVDPPSRKLDFRPPPTLEIP